MTQPKPRSTRGLKRTVERTVALLILLLFAAFGVWLFVRIAAHKAEVVTPDADDPIRAETPAR